MIHEPPATGRWADLRRGIRIEQITIGWMIVEVIASLLAAVMAGSVALMAFGLDSGIELLSAGVLLWRLGLEISGAHAQRVATAERRAQSIVGWTLLALSVYVVVDAAWAFLHPQALQSPALLGVLVAAAAVVIMPILVRAKRTIAAAIGSQALMGDAAEGVVCAYMAAVLLVGLVLRSWFGWWWADPVAAMGIVYFIVREAFEALGEAREESEDGAH